MIMADRNVFKFNLDRFEVLARPYEDNVDVKSRLFWEGAQSYRIAVELVETFVKTSSSVEYKPQVDRTVVSHKYSNQNLRDAENEVEVLEGEVLKLRERTNLLKMKNKVAAIINPWNFVIAGFLSMALAFLFS